MPEREILFREALIEAMAEEMRHDETIFLMGDLTLIDAIIPVPAKPEV